MQAERIIGIKYLGKQKTVNITVNSKNHLYYHNGICGQNSHSVQYGIRAFQEAYIKSHWPLHFFTAKLKSPRKSTDQTDIANLIHDAKLFNIQTKLPNLKHCRPEFYNDGTSIYFGLSNIRDFGDSSYVKLNTIFQEHGKEGFTGDFFEFVINCAKYLTPSIVKLLIESGSVDFFNMPRQQMLAEYALVSDMTKTESERLLKFYDADKAGVIL